MQSSEFGLFLGGLTIGVLTAFLFAPQSGQETREQIAETAKQGRDLLEDVIDDLRYQVESSVEEARERVAVAVQSGSRAYRDELDARRTGQRAHFLYGSSLFVV